MNRELKVILEVVAVEGMGQTNHDQRTGQPHQLARDAMRYRGVVRSIEEAGPTAEVLRTEGGLEKLLRR